MQMPRVPTPTDEEITAAGIILGKAEPGQRMRGFDRARVAKTIQVADQLPPEEEEQPVSDPIALIAQTHADLLKAGLTSFAADRVVAALAPQIWRDNPGAAHALR